eukprot:TRINITY_DN88775_c0_g1_i1.p1 TRINITY_DN88775_c0_g1~~TRINITY_DN88775_c0_g1_i1.p1  ORF type:complete len:666 (+),score=111.86 TRINITY_DN88775_c0_g1_i1:43-1998(+)
MVDEHDGIGDLRLALVTACSIGNATNKVSADTFRKRICEAAELACTEECCRHAAKAVDEIIAATGKDDTLDTKAALYTVDHVLRRNAQSQAQHKEDPYASRAVSVLLPHLGAWLHKMLLERRSEKGLERMRSLIGKWRDAGWLKLEAVIPLLELLNEPNAASQPRKSLPGTSHPCAEQEQSLSADKKERASAAKSVSPRKEELPEMQSRRPVSVTVQASHLAALTKEQAQTADAKNSSSALAKTTPSEKPVQGRSARSHTDVHGKPSFGHASDQKSLMQHASVQGTGQVNDTGKPTCDRSSKLKMPDARSAELAKQECCPSPSPQKKRTTTDIKCSPPVQASKMRRLSSGSTSSKPSLPVARPDPVSPQSSGNAVSSEFLSVPTARCVFQQSPGGAASAVTPANNDRVPQQLPGSATSAASISVPRVDHASQQSAGSTASAVSVSVPKTDCVSQQPPTTADAVVPQALASPQKTPADSSSALPRIFRVLGDCRCLFRAVWRAIHDPWHQVARDPKGEPTSEAARLQEQEGADQLRIEVCVLMKSHAEEVAQQLAGDETVDDYLAKMQDWKTWGDAICLNFLADLVRQPIQVYGLNQTQMCMFDSGLYLPRDKSLRNEPVIFLWYNGRSHYDLVSIRWLREREQMLCQSTQS